jgi:hypothetical protein
MHALPITRVGKTLKPSLFRGIAMNPITRIALLACATLLPCSTQAVVSDYSRLYSVSVQARTYFCTAKVQDDGSGHFISDIIVQNTDATRRIQVTQVVYYGNSGAILKDLSATKEAFPADFSPLLQPMQSSALLGDSLFPRASDETAGMSVQVSVKAVDPTSSPQAVAPYVTVSTLSQDASGEIKSRAEVECTPR